MDLVLGILLCLFAYLSFIDCLDVHSNGVSNNLLWLVAIHGDDPAPGHALEDFLLFRGQLLIFFYLGAV